MLWLIHVTAANLEWRWNEAPEAVPVIVLQEGLHQVGFGVCSQTVGTHVTHLAGERYIKNT